MSRNVLFLIVGCLVAVVGVLSYNVYQDRKEPDGIQISVDKKGLEIKGN